MKRLAEEPEFIEKEALEVESELPSLSYDIYRQGNSDIQTMRENLLCIVSKAYSELLDNLSKTVNYINENRMYVIAMTNHPKVYEVFKNEINSKFIRVALGMHPELAEKANMVFFKKYVHSTKYIGEIGLDFSKQNTNHEQQEFIFDEILNISKQKIFSIHST